MKTRKELKEAYKQRKSKMGVFQIKNNTNGKIFIGSSIDLDAMWNRQKMQLQFGNHPNKALQKEWKEFGEEINKAIKNSLKLMINYEKRK